MPDLDQLLNEYAVAHHQNRSAAQAFEAARERMRTSAERMREVKLQIAALYCEDAEA